MYTKEDIIDLQNDIEYWKNKYDDIYLQNLIYHYTIIQCIEYIEDYADKNFISNDSETWNTEIKDIRDILKGAIKDE